VINSPYIGNHAAPTMFCRLYGCTGKITAEMLVEKEAIHFNCEFGHKFHADLKDREIDLCYCQSEAARTNDSGKSGGT
jgi:hypothetical protein